MVSGPAVAEDDRLVQRGPLGLSASGVVGIRAQPGLNVTPAVMATVGGLPGTSLDIAQRELDGISDRFWNNLVASFTGPGPQRAGAPGPQGEAGSVGQAGPVGPTGPHQLSSRALIWCSGTAISSRQIA